MTNLTSHRVFCYHEPMNLDDNPNIYVLIKCPNGCHVIDEGVISPRAFLYMVLDILDTVPVVKHDGTWYLAPTSQVAVLDVIFN